MGVIGDSIVFVWVKFGGVMDFLYFDVLLLLLSIVRVFNFGSINLCKLNFYKKIV